MAVAGVDVRVGAAVKQELDRVQILPTVVVADGAVERLGLLRVDVGAMLQQQGLSRRDRFFTAASSGVEHQASTLTLGSAPYWRRRRSVSIGSGRAPRRLPAGRRPPGFAGRVRPDRRNSSTISHPAWPGRSLQRRRRLGRGGP